MRNGIKQMGATVASWTLMAAVLWVGFSGVSLAADPKPKTVVNTTASSNDPLTTALTVEINLMQMQANAENPEVPSNGLQATLQQHFPTSLGSGSDWQTVTTQSPQVDQHCCRYDDQSTLGSLALVKTFDFEGLCSLIDKRANSIRVVGVVTVTNAQKGTKDKPFLGRSISMANPCKQPS